MHQEQHAEQTESRPMPRKVFFFSFWNRSRKGGKEMPEQMTQEAEADAEKQVGVDMTREKGRKTVTDLEVFFKSRYQIARQRNLRFQQRFDSLRACQMKWEDILERIRTNPISQLSNSEIEKGCEMDAVIRLTNLRRQDTFSKESASINRDISEFETEICSWFRMVYLTLETAMEAPLPELGRPAALKKELWTSLKYLCSCSEFRFYMTSSGKTLHQLVSDHAANVQKTFNSAQEKLDTLYPDVEQPMKVEPLFDVEEALHSLETTEQEYLRPPSPEMNKFAIVTSPAKQQ